MKSHLLIFASIFVTTLSQSQQCFDSADRPINGRCFKLVNKQLSYTDALNFCHYSNPYRTYLARVTDLTTANFLASYARTSFNINKGDFWIGLSRASSSSKFQWDDGTPLAYTNFNQNSQNSQNYVSESITNGKWNTYSPDTLLNFICSYDPNGPYTGGPVTEGTTEPVFWTTESETVSPTPTDNTLCTPTTSSTFLFAYSNDLDSDTVLDVWYYDAYPNHYSPHFSTVANIRFDVTKEDDIQYHSNLSDVHASILSHLPDPSLGFGDSNTGSDVLKMIEKFLDNRQAPICASKLLILVKRYPNETEIDRLVAKIRQYHVSLGVIYSVQPSGGHHSETLYNLATRTNGLCAFDYNSNFVNTAIEVPSCFNPYLIYAANPQILGRGNISLPTMRVPADADYWFEMTIQDKMPIDYNESVKLTWSRFGSSNTTSLGVSGGYCSNGFYGGNYAVVIRELDQSSYSMSLNYKFSDSNVKTLQIRVHTNKPVNYWVPYDD